MAEFDEHATLEEAIDAAARGLVKKTSDELGRSVEYFSLEELAKLEARRAANAASGNTRTGVRLYKCVPPSTG